jgi:hypothetical protein
MKSQEVVNSAGEIMLHIFCRINFLKFSQKHISVYRSGGQTETNSIMGLWSNNFCSTGVWD